MRRLLPRVSRLLLRTILLCGSALAACSSGNAPDSENQPDLSKQYEPPLTGNPLWAHGLGGKLFDTINGVAVDPSGNGLFAGTLEGEVDTGGGPLPGGGSYDVLITKYSPLGQHVWTRRASSVNEERALAITSDAQGSVYVAGYFRGSLDFGKGALTAAGSGDIFVVKYSAEGVLQWSRRFGGPGNDAAQAIAVDPSGQLVVTGYFEQACDFGSGVLTSAGKNDAFLLKLSSSGEHLWSRRFGGAASDSGFGLATDAQGRVLVVGGYSGTIDFGGGPLVSNGEDDGFVARFDPSGAYQFALHFGGPGNDDATSVTTDAAGNIVVGGFFHDTLSLGNATLQSLGKEDLLVFKLSPSGTVLWSRAAGGPETDAVTSVALTTRGHVILGGYFTTMLDLGGGPLRGAGNLDVVVARLHSDGSHLWSKAFGGSGLDAATALATDSQGSVMVGGYLQTTLDAGSGPIPSAGGYDALMLRLAP